MEEITELAYNLVLALVKELPLSEGLHSFNLSFRVNKIDEDTVEILDVDCRQSESNIDKLITVLYNTDQRLDIMEKLLARSAQSHIEKSG